MIVDLLVTWVVYAAALMVGAKALTSVRVNDWGAAFGAAAAFGVINALLGWLIVWVVTVLSLPAIILTLGLFALLIHLIVNMILLKLADAVTGKAFDVDDLGGLFGLALIMSLAGWVAGRLT